MMIVYTAHIDTDTYISSTSYMFYIPQFRTHCVFSLRGAKLRRWLSTLEAEKELLKAVEDQ